MPSATIGCLLSNRIESLDTTFRVFCFPHAGAGASAFRAWIRDPPPGVQICAVQLPGREDRIREALSEDMGALVRLLAPMLLPHLDVPYAFIGNSMGALVAFEMARHFQERYCLPPVRLVAAAARPPGTAQGLPSVRGATDQELASAMQELHGGIPPEILHDRGHQAVFLPVLRADLALIDGYRPAPRPLLACPVTAVRGTADTGLPAAEMSGWGEFTENGFDRVELPGGHFALLEHRDEIVGPVLAEAASVRPDRRPRSRARQAEVVEAAGATVALG